MRGVGATCEWILSSERSTSKDARFTAQKDSSRICAVKKLLTLLRCCDSVKDGEIMICFCGFEMKDNQHPVIMYPGTQDAEEVRVLECPKCRFAIMDLDFVLHKLCKVEVQVFYGQIAAWR